MLSFNYEILNNNKFYFLLYLFVLLILTSCIMMFYDPLCTTEWDFYFHYNRLAILMDAMKDGNLPFYMDNHTLLGYGYFTKAFYPDLILYPFAIIGNITTLYIGYQCLIFTMTILCGIFTYVAVNRIYKNRYAAVITGILLTFSVFRIFDLYLRSALAEAISFTFLPLVVLGAYEIIKGNYKKWYILTIAFFLLINTHIISTVLTFLLLVLFLLIYCKTFVNEPRRFIFLLLSGVVAVALSAQFIIPLLEQLMTGDFWLKDKPAIDFKYSVMSMTTILSGLFSYMGASTAKIGGLLLACVCLRFFVKEKGSLIRSLDYMLLVSVICLCANSYLFPWSVFPFNKLNFIQFPWRLYQFVTVFFSFAGGYYIALLLKNTGVIRKLAFLMTIIILTLLVFKTEQVYIDCEANYHENETEMNVSDQKKIVGAEYIPSKVPSLDYVYERGNKVGTKYDDSRIEDLKKEKGITSFNVLTRHNDESLELPLFYYKGYQVTLDGRDIAVEESENGLIKVNVKQSGNIKAYYAGTIIQRISTWITILSLVLMIAYIYFPYYRKKKTAL